MPEYPLDIISDNMDFDDDPGPQIKSAGPVIGAIFAILALGVTAMLALAIWVAKLWFPPSPEPATTEPNSISVLIPSQQ